MGCASLHPPYRVFSSWFRLNAEPQTEMFIGAGTRYFS
ncbi:Uncharacterized protein dnm_006350 [Desulfonema magnum]|uniref:Uncharacterized protein n=1 Tax=Desulfonema magnum TaxID=45655 RepID=A0A975BFX7_9BACT|nr:Uncharacterized protein dnm_006350 [Desulfonema magnum]